MEITENEPDDEVIPVTHDEFRKSIELTTIFITEAQDFLNDAIEASEIHLPPGTNIGVELKAFEASKTHMERYINELNESIDQSDERKELRKKIEGDLKKVVVALEKITGIYQSAHMSIQSMKQLKADTISFKNEYDELSETKIHMKSVVSMMKDFIRKFRLDQKERIMRRPNIYVADSPHLDAFYNIYVKNLVYLRTRVHLCIGCWEIVTISTDKRSSSKMKGFTTKKYPLMIHLPLLVNSTYLKRDAPRKINIQDLIYFLINSDHQFLKPGVGDNFIRKTVGEQSEEYFPFPDISFKVDTIGNLNDGSTSSNKTTNQKHDCLKKNVALADYNYNSEQMKQYRWEELLKPSMTQTERLTISWLQEKLNLLPNVRRNDNPQPMIQNEDQSQGEGEAQMDDSQAQPNTSVVNQMEMRNRDPRIANHPSRIDDEVQSPVPNKNDKIRVDVLKSIMQSESSGTKTLLPGDAILFINQDKVKIYRAHAFDFKYIVMDGTHLNGYYTRVREMINLSNNRAPEGQPAQLPVPAIENVVNQTTINQSSIFLPSKQY